MLVAVVVAAGIEGGGKGAGTGPGPAGVEVEAAGATGAVLVVVVAAGAVDAGTDDVAACDAVKAVRASLGDCPFIVVTVS